MSPPGIGPLSFTPRCVERVWGGRRLADELGKDLPPEGRFGESWEMSAHPSAPGAVDAGVLAGRNIADLTREFGAEFLGAALDPLDTFPLLFKFIDACDVLSVQVHPGDEYARTHEGGQLGKSEAWYVLAAKPGARLYRGLTPGATREVFREKLAAGRTVECVHGFEVRAGDCLHLPHGTVHAIGAGVLLAEIQESSDLTYRIHDWNRMGLDGKPRELHLDKALDVIDFDPGGPNFGPERAEPRAIEVPGAESAERLVGEARFHFERLMFTAPARLTSDPERFWMLACIAGAGCIAAGETSIGLSAGRTVLIPAAAGAFEVIPHEPLTILRAFVP